MKKDKNKVIQMSITIVLILLIIASTTYALAMWSSQNNTELTTSIGDLADVVFNKGNDINITNMGPVLNYEDGEIVEFSVLNRADATLEANIILNILSISNNLKVSSFKYKVLSSTDNINFTELDTGSFLNKTTGNLEISSSTIFTRTTYYKVYFYIDGNMTNPTTMQNQLFTAIVNVNVESQADIKVNAVTINGTLGNAFPINPSGYDVTTNCANSTSVWNSKTLSVDVTATTVSSLECSPTFISPTSKTYLNNHIISLATAGTLQGEATGDGYVIHETATFNSTDYDAGYRYEGRNPYNYIWFNNELWRIIGVFDDADHDVTGTNLTKIIRSTSLGSYVWSKNNTNNWATSSLRTLLNTYYYNKINDDNGDSINNYCYGNEDTIPAVCDFNNYGISSTYRNMIQSVTWQLGGNGSNAIKADDSYVYERGNDANGSNSANVEDYIGLMYPSDFGFASLEYTTPSSGTTKCARTILLSNYATTACAGSNWLFGQGNEWMLMHLSNAATNSMYISNNGTVLSNTSKLGYSTRPVLYLKDSVYIIDGNGSINNPYIIGM